ncbi:HIT family hydrolase [Streptomyces sp. NA04227]|nr:HIT family hydrolase [Streptomyces sp. NA04227]
MGAAERGENPTVLGRMRSGWAVIGDVQHLPGYCLLLHAGTATALNELPRAERAEFLYDVSLLGEVVETVCRRRDPGFRRLNHEILGNTWEHLHAHLHPRFHWEPEEFRKGPVWRYGDARLAPAHRLGPRHDALRAELTETLRGVLAEAYQEH